MIPLPSSNTDHGALLLAAKWFFSTLYPELQARVNIPADVQTVFGPTAGEELVTLG